MMFAERRTGLAKSAAIASESKREEHYFDCCNNEKWSFRVINKVQTLGVRPKFFTA